MLIQIITGSSICSACQTSKNTKRKEENANNANPREHRENGKANSYPTSNTNSLRPCIRAKIYEIWQEADQNN